MKILLMMLVCGCLVCGAPQYDDGYDEDEYGDIFGTDDDEEDDIFVDDVETINDDIFEATKKKNEPLRVQGENGSDCTDIGNDELIFDIREDRSVIQDCDENVKCSHYASQGFQCAPYYQCQNKSRSPVITDGKGKTDVHLIDLRSNRCVKLEGTLDASDDKCETEGHVCCKDPDVNARKCKEEKHDDFSKCGRTSQKTKITKLDSKAKGSAQPGEFTHMCVIYKNTDGSQIYHGGASLIAKNKVITVAHKFWVERKKRSQSVDYRDIESSFIVRCAEYNVRKENELIKHQETKVQKMYFHPLYDPKDKYVRNNLVILRTKENFIYQYIL